jgi:ATP-dependent Zn protease
LGFFPAGKRGILVNSTVRTFLFWGFIGVCLLFLFAVVQRSSSMNKVQDISYSDLFQRAQQGQIKDASIDGDQLHGHLKTNEEFNTTIPERYDALDTALRASGVHISIAPQKSSIPFQILINVAMAPPLGTPSNYTGLARRATRSLPSGGPPVRELL